MNYRSYQDLSDDIKSNIYKLEKYNIDLVVGIPRSGMIPAYMISLILNVHCTDFYSFIENRQLHKGQRKVKKNGDVNLFPHDHNNILLVDDSIYTGKDMKEKKSVIPDNLKNKITTAAIYSTELKRDDIDCFFVYLPNLRLFEWNIFHVQTLSWSCVDIDGVLCKDPTNAEDDDGEGYINFIKNAIPFILPTYKIHSLVTNRLEKYRCETEIWLKNHGITYDNLIMLNLPTKEERQKTKVYAKHKARFYRNSNTRLFIESSFFEAKEICLLSGKDVYCVETNTVLTANSLSILINNPKGLKKYVPGYIKKVLRPVINILKVYKKSLGVGKSSFLKKPIGMKHMKNGINSPNIRKVRNVTNQRELTAFEKIVMLSTYCMCKDCTHTSEEGCAVHEALVNETLDKDSYENYLKKKHKKVHTKLQLQKK
jgi:uncharacterized HAD superfamily protein